MIQITQLATHKSELMSLNNLLKLTRFLIPVLITSLLVSCSASQHAGVTTINEPPLVEDKLSTWLLYYQDQFDANEGNVIPPSNQYPQSAVRAYQRAKMNWDDKVQDAKSKTVDAYIVLGVVVVLCVIIVESLPFHISSGLSGK